MLAAITRLGAWLHARAENLLAAMLALMFGVFIIQIIFRYIINLPIGWTQEISVIMWVWMVLFGTAFVVRDQEEIRFDILYATVSERTRRIMVVVCAFAVIILFGTSLPAVLDYIGFMKVEKTAYMKIRFDWLYSIYGAFAVATIIRQLWLGYQAIWGKQDAPQLDVTKITSGV